MRRESDNTNVRRASLALVAGALTGAIVVTVPYIALSLYFYGAATLEAQDILFIALFLFATAVVWAIGLAVLGVPLWCLLHKLGWTSRRAACLLGAATAFVASFALQVAFPVRVPMPGALNGVVTSGGPIADVTWLHRWWDELQTSALLGVAGIIVALVIRRIGYGAASQDAT